MGSAYGAAAVEREGVSVLWRGKILAGFRFTVDESGFADGDWGMTGFGTQEVEFSGVAATAELDYSGGGTIEGSDTTLVAFGDATTTGVVQPFGQSINTTAPIPALFIDIDVFCNEMWGDWALTVEQAFEDSGFSGGDAATSFDGVMIGHVRYEGFSDEAIEVLTENGFTLDMVNSWAGDYAIAERVEFELVTIEAHFAAVSAAAQRLEDEYPNWSGPDAYAVVDQIHTLLNVLRNLSGCTQRILGEDQIERWTDSLHRLLRRLIAKLVDLELYPGRPPRGQGFANPGVAPEPEPDPVQATLAYAQLVDFATRSAVIGAGALDPDDAAVAEQELIDAGSRLLAGLDGAGGSDDDRRRVLAIGALMGWTFDVDGELVDAAGALAELGFGGGS